MSDENEELLPKNENAVKPSRGRKKRLERPKVDFPDPQSAHKKFLAVMIGLFLLFLMLMIVFNQHFDFAVDGGI